jgi:two-component system chemotaxis sensor kinase CheA
MCNIKNRTVLLVDDVESNIFALSSYLETLDVHVLVAKNGKEAIEILEGGACPAVILLDMMMPVLDGYETLKILKGKGILEHLPVIAVTARAMKGDRAKCLEAGAWDYISKPINLELLNEKLSQLFR